MDDIFEGVFKFKNEDYEKYKNLFAELENGQNPHTLFIGCSDSRVVPSLITKTLPGELFMVRNIANMVPPYRETEEYVSTTSAIEFAIEVLNVKNIVVCGHSNCGGCASLYKSEEELKNVPHVRKWLELANPVKEYVLNNINTEEGKNIQKSLMTEQFNIVHQVNNLFTYPFIKEKYINKEINIYGWYYMIATGEVYNYDKKNGSFTVIAK
ncbi:MAG: carbonic anhydrase [Candidatus Acididesulfobacter guangdongensis]|uniref:Carbonic anhydrase n=1 Tax=Acididesulfobacter guangdongensis TaxID=2597225 RepID=A0A519BEJ7_ACIG2|nr:MAG: carbonic anhydrase [Candidatus Acididesulfobacter guangdongensis]